MRTDTGKPFSATSLRDALLAWHVAGLVTCNGAQYDAPAWLEPIIEPDRWQRLADPGRRTNAGNANAPRWLLSGPRPVRGLRGRHHHARPGNRRVRPSGAAPTGATRGHTAPRPPSRPTRP
ncbi:MAG: hypothetical protein ACRDPY_47780 [Streptosporangiaceae bacterium]